MTTQDAFNKFYSSILLDASRQARMESALKSLREFCEADEQLKQKTAFYLQGSVANGTNTQPPTEKAEFDIDVVIGFTFKENTVANDAFSWIEGRLRLRKDYSTRIKTSKKRCVRLEYAGDFHLDIVPAHHDFPSSDLVLIPVRKNGWEQSKPRAFSRWCDDLNKKSGSDFSRIVRMMKWWRSNETYSRNQISSIVLTTLLEKSLPSATNGKSTTSDAKLVEMAFIGLAAWASQNRTKPWISNPVMSSEDLASEWSETDYQTFKKLVDEGAKTARRATSSGRLDVWKELFGNRFPTI